MRNLIYFLVLILFACAPPAAELKKDSKAVLDPSLILLQDYLREVHIGSLWFHAAQIESGSFTPPKEKSIYVGFSSRFFIQDMKSGLEEKIRFREKMDQAKSNVERKLIFFDEITSDIIIDLPSLSTLIVGPQASTLRALDPENPSEEAMLSCLNLNLRKRLSGKSREAVPVSSELKKYLDESLSKSQLYPYEKTSMAVTYQQAAMSVWLTRVKNDQVGDAYVAVEFDRTVGKENLYVSVFPIEAIVVDEVKDKMCQ